MWRSLGASSETGGVPSAEQQDAEQQDAEQRDDAESS
jgi:hypothetical protein